MAHKREGITCPACGELVDGVQAINDEENPLPKPGDVTICIYCGELLIFDEDGKERVPTEEEINDIKQDKANWKLIVAAIEVIKENN